MSPNTGNRPIFRDILVAAVRRIFSLGGFRAVVTGHLALAKNFASGVAPQHRGWRTNVCIVAKLCAD